MGAAAPILMPHAIANAQEASSAVRDMPLKDLVLTFGTTTIRAPDALVSGTRLSQESVLAILKSEGAEPWPARLARLEAGGFSAPELRIEIVRDDNRQTTIFRDVKARGIAAGRIAELSAAGASLTAQGPQARGSGSYGRIVAQEIDLPTLARLQSERGDGKGPLQKIYGSVSIADIGFDSAEGTIRIASVVGKDFAGRQTPSTWSGTMDAFRAVDLEKAAPAERARLAAAAADLAEAFSVGSLEATGMSFAAKGGDPFTLEVKRIGYANSGPESGVTLTGMAFFGEAGRLSLDQLRFSDFSLAPTIAGLRVVAAAPEAKPEPRRLMPTIGNVSVIGFSLDPKNAAAGEVTQPPPAPPAPDAVRPAEPAPASPPTANRPIATDPLDSGMQTGLRPGPADRIGVREASLDLGPPREGVPTTSRIALKGLTIPSALVAGAPVLGALASYGYKDLDLDVTVDSAWDEATKEIRLRDIALSGRDMGSLHLTGTLGGIGPEFFDPDSVQSGLAALSLTAKALDLTVKDSGLYGRFIETQAKTLSLKPEELRQEYVTACLIGIPVILGGSPAAQTLGAAMSKFAKQPGTLTVKAKAKNPAGLGAIDISGAGTAGAVVDKLEIDAKAE